MKHFETTLQIVIATWAACVWLTGNLFAAEPAFVVKLTTDKQVYLLGEPTTLTATIKFLGQETIEVTHPLDHGEYSETVEFSTKGNSIFNRFITREEASDALEIGRASCRERVCLAV